MPGLLRSGRTWGATWPLGLLTGPQNLFVKSWCLVYRKRSGKP